MRERLEPWLQSIWYGGKRPPLALRALATVYGGISALRGKLYQLGWLKSQRASVPVIVVGNLTAGGSGKTPTIIALAQALRNHGYAPGIVSRGYGGNYGATWQQVAPDADPVAVGDEPVLLARCTGAPVVVARRRIAGARALASMGCNVVLADDGLQHHALARDLEILVVHGQRRFGNERLLPAGPLRERPHAKCYDWVLVTGAAPRAGEFGLHSELGEAINLSDGRTRSLTHWHGQNVAAFAGIADPQRFFDALTDHGMVVQAHPFPDHHHYTDGDFDFASGSGSRLDLLCTSKDAVKLRALNLPDLSERIWEVPLLSQLPDQLLRELMQRLVVLRGATV